MNVFIDKIDWTKLGVKRKPLMGVEHFLCKSKVTVYHHKHMIQGEMNNMGVVNHFFHNLKQPTKSDVLRALILIINEDYALRQGGDNMSSSDFSSSFKITIADPKTGLDKDVVLIKKWSNVFSDILITAEEIRELFKSNLSAKEKAIVDHQNMISTLAFTLRALKGYKVNIGGTNKKASKANIDMLINACSKFPLKNIDEFINQRINKCIAESEIKIVEDVKGVNKTENHKLSCINNANGWRRLKDLIHNSSKRELITHKV